MRRISAYFFTLIFSVILVSCEQEIARVDLLKNNSKEIFFLLEKEDVVEFYTEIDIEYKEKLLFVYDCEAYHGNTLLFKGGTDPLITTANKNETQITKDGITHWKFYGKLDGNLTANMDGEYSVITTFLKNSSPDLKINKVDIVFVK